MQKLWVVTALVCAACSDDDVSDELPVDAGADARMGDSGRTDASDDEDAGRTDSGAEDAGGVEDAGEEQDASQDAGSAGGKSPDDPIPLSDDGDSFTGTLSGPADSFFFLVPYTPNHYGFILGTPESNTASMTASFHPGREVGLTNPGSGGNGCIVNRGLTPTDGSCGKQIRDFGGVVPTEATIHVFGTGEFSLELVRLSGPIDAPATLPPTAIRIETIQNVTALLPSVVADAQRPTMRAALGPGPDAVFFPLPSDERVTCWSRPVSFSPSEAATPSIVQVQFTSSLASMMAFTSGIGLFVTGEPGAAFASAETATLTVTPTTIAEQTLSPVAPTFTGSSPPIEAETGEVRFPAPNASLSYDAFYMRINGVEKIVECYADAPAAGQPLVVMDESVPRDLEAREVAVPAGVSNSITMGACNESTPLDLGPAASYWVFMCIAVGVEPAAFGTAGL